MHLTLCVKLSYNFYFTDARLQEGAVPAIAIRGTITRSPA